MWERRSCGVDGERHGIVAQRNLDRRVGGFRTVVCGGEHLFSLTQVVKPPIGYSLGPGMQSAFIQNDVGLTCAPSAWRRRTGLLITLDDGRVSGGPGADVLVFQDTSRESIPGRPIDLTAPDGRSPRVFPSAAATANALGVLYYEIENDPRARWSSLSFVFGTRAGTGRVFDGQTADGLANAGCRPQSPRAKRTPGTTSRSRATASDSLPRGPTVETGGLESIFGWSRQSDDWHARRGRSRARSARYPRCECRRSPGSTSARRAAFRKR